MLVLAKKRTWSILALYCCLLCALVSFSTVESAAKKRSNYDTYAATENGTCYKRVPYDEAVIANLSQGLIKTESTTPPPGVQSWITIIDCCDGYRRDEYGDCSFYCEEGCGGGNCTGPNECTCEGGWRAVHGECKPLCRQRCPPNAYCFSPDVCECLFGFEMIDGICRPICQHNCRNGDCVGPADCRCHRGYFLNDTRHCEPICESGCKHGLCVAPGVCSCDQGYVNQLYNTESCVPECPPECVNGECVTPNVCTCKAGYQQNDNGTCEAQCEETCPENASCFEPNKCGCNDGYTLDIQGKNCVKLPPNAQNYPNRGNFPSRNNQGQGYGVNNVYNTQQNRPYGNGAGTYTTQRPGYGRNPYGQGGVYQTDNPYGYVTTENPQGVIGLNDPVQNPNPTQNPQEGFYLTTRPPRPYTPQGTYSTSTPYPDNRGGYGTSTTPYPGNRGGYGTSTTPYPGNRGGYGTNTTPYPGNRGGYGTSTTYRPPANDPRYTTLNPFAPVDPYPTEYPQYNYGNRGYRPVNSSSQGPFAPQTPNRYHTTQSPFRPDEQGHTVGPYGPYDTTTQPPWNHNQNRNPYDRTNPYGQQTPNNYPNQRPNSYDQHRPSPYNPYSPTSPHDQDGVKTGSRRPYEPQQPYNPQIPYNPYAPVSPHEQGVKNTHGRPPYGSQGPDQRYNPYAPNAGAQRPSTDIYSRSSVMQDNPQSGIRYSYGIDHLNRVPPTGRPINGQPGPLPEPFIVTDPYAQPGTGNIGGIIIIDGQHVPGSNQLEPLCNGPCINSHCIGLNLCMCEIGFIPDPSNPGGNACVPI